MPLRRAAQQVLRQVWRSSTLLRWHFGLPIVPHNTQTGASAVNIVQFASAVENIGGYMEFPHRGNEKKETWYSPAFQIRNGTIRVPDAPGLGIEFDAAYLAKAVKISI